MKPQIAPHTSLTRTRKKHFRTFAILIALILVIMPFVTTFNEVLTKGVMSIKAYQVIQARIVPYEAKLVGVILKILGIYSEVSKTSIYIRKGNQLIGVFISWNCIGWQSIILFAITLITGLQGPYTTVSKVETVSIGLLGTLLVNILRVTLVTLFAYYFGQLPAVIFHDYGSTVMIVVWLLLFWYISYTFVLERKQTGQQMG